MNVQSCFVSAFISIYIAQLFLPANPQNAKFIILIKLCKKGKYVLFSCLIRRILCFFNQFAKRNETFIIRLINTGGTSGKTSPDYVINKLKLLYCRQQPVRICHLTKEEENKPLTRKVKILILILFIYQFRCAIFRESIP